MYQAFYDKVLCYMGFVGILKAVCYIINIFIGFY